MISFIQLCELLTTKQKHSWFYFYKNDVPYLSKEEVSTIYIEPCRDDELIRIWYPKSKWTDRKLCTDDFKKQLQLAIDNEDFAEIKRLKQNQK